MSKKDRLGRLIGMFTDDVTYLYHLKKIDIGYLIYVIEDECEFTTDTLEFSPTILMEDLVEQCFIKTKKIAPGVLYTEEINDISLTEKLNTKLEQNFKFTDFINSISDSYFIDIINDFIKYKKDPTGQDKKDRDAYIQNQKRLIKKVIGQSKFSKRQLNFSKDSTKELVSKLNNKKYKSYHSTIKEILDKRKINIKEF